MRYLSEYISLIGKEYKTPISLFKLNQIFNRLVNLLDSINQTLKLRNATQVNYAHREAHFPNVLYLSISSNIPSDV